MLCLCRRGAVLMTLLQLTNPLCALRAGEVYKSIDAEGHVVYSDRAPTSTAEKSVVRVDQPDPVEVARHAKEQAILSAEDAQRKKDQAIEDRKKAQKAQEEYNRQVGCDNARNRYYALKDARRLYQRDADGNRVYDNDADADAKREEARLAMVSACEA
jgi:Domain of unknown function (DUF4124)